MGKSEGVGDAISGGLPGRAVEPAAGKTAAGHTRETHCLNCGSPLNGPFCSECGQHAYVHRTLRAFGDDFLTGVLNFEGKIFHTLPLLAWQPGQLTRRYIDGQRARFVSPFGVFLFSVFLLFATIQSLGGSGRLGEFKADGQTYHSTDEAIAGMKGKLRSQQAKRARADPGEIKGINEQIADESASLATLERFKREGLANAVLADKDAVNVKSSVPIVNDAINRAKANPQLALYRLQDAASKYAWVLIPISAPLMWLLFPFSRRFRLYDHTIFVTYSLAFMILLAVAVTLWSATGLPGAELAAFAPPVHVYRDLKGTYSLGRAGALWRTAILLLFAVIALALFAMAVVVLGMSS